MKYAYLYQSPYYAIFKFVNTYRMIKSLHPILMSSYFVYKIEQNLKKKNLIIEILEETNNKLVIFCVITISKCTAHQVGNWLIQTKQGKKDSKIYKGFASLDKTRK